MAHEKHIKHTPAERREPQGGSCIKHIPHRTRYRAALEEHIQHHKHIQQKEERERERLKEIKLSSTKHTPNGHVAVEQFYKEAPLRW